MNRNRWLKLGFVLCGFILASILYLWLQKDQILKLGPNFDPAIVVNPRSPQSGVVISLHTWNGSYKQFDPLRESVEKLGWGYIRPNFTGPNKTSKNCLSDDVITDLNAAVEYAIREWGVPQEKIALVGLSGGGHAALGYWHKGTYRLGEIMAWVPITDLVEWHRFCSSEPRFHKYARDIENIVGNEKGRIDIVKAKERSPLYMELRRGQWSHVSLFAGVNDGHDGSVPISHSIDYFNRLASEFKPSLVDEATKANLLSRKIAPTSEFTPDGRRVILRRHTDISSLLIFEGGHELLVDTCIEELKKKISSE